jgi:plastocyanin
MRSIIRALPFALWLVLGGMRVAAQPLDPPAPAMSAEQTVTVSLKENRFRPARLTIAAGTTVIWSNDEDDPDNAHNVISRDYRWASSDFLPGERYQHTFPTAGDYRYFCDLHGGMVGRVIVE